MYFYSSCVYCLIVRLALWWLDLKVALKDTALHPENQADLIAGGGKHQVPCLRVENEQGEARWIYETIDIIRYLKTVVPS